MEHINASQQANYERILQETANEYALHETLKKNIDNLQNHATIMNILAKKDLARRKIFQVKVKLFDNIFELFQTFGENIKSEDINRLRQCINYKFYFIEIFISRLLREKLITQNSLLNVTIYNTKNKVSKVLNMKNRFSNPIFTVLPADVICGALETYLSVDLVFTLENSQFWPCMNLNIILIDISYHFDAHQCTSEKQIEQKILKINDCHNKEIAFKPIKQNFRTYSFQCDWTIEKLFETVLRNSYHKKDLVNCFNTLENVATFKILINDNKVVIELDTHDKKLNIIASHLDLLLIKRYLLLTCNSYKKEHFGGITAKIQDLQHDLEKELSYSNIQQSNLCNIYEEYFKCIEKYPLRHE